MVDVNKSLGDGALSRTGTRMTIEMGDHPSSQAAGGAGLQHSGGAEESVGGFDTDGRVFRPVPSDEPRVKRGMYWGYRTRSADSLLDAINKEFEGGELRNVRGREPYDLIVGTSEHGQSVESVAGPSASGQSRAGGFPSFQRCIIVFGGPRGLEPVATSLSHSTSGASANPSDYFDFYLNTCASQGSRTIRTEEAVLISLARLVEPLRQANRRDRNAL